MAAQNMTLLQKNHLIALMEEMHLLLYGRHPTSNGTAVKKIMWKKVTQELNNLGAKKTVNQWKECWSRIKSKVKEKHAMIRNNLIKSGAGPLHLRLSSNDLKVTNILKKVNVDGNVELGESGLQGKRFRHVNKSSKYFFDLKSERNERFPAQRTTLRQELSKHDEQSTRKIAVEETLRTIRQQHSEIVKQNIEVKKLQRVINYQTKEIMMLLLKKKGF